jgi:hypothetical protein
MSKMIANLFLQNIGRYMIIFIGQPIVSFIFLYLSYKIITRKTNKSTIFLSLAYLMVSLSFLLNLFYILFSLFLPLKILFFLYKLIAYTLFLGPAFLLIFLSSLLGKYNLKYQILYLILYNLSILYLIFFYDEIDIDPISLRPSFSWEFLISTYLFLSFFALLPILWYSITLTMYIQNKILRKRFNYVTIGVIFMLLCFYGAILYNTWESEVYSSIWSFISLTLLPSAAIITYLGLIPNLS